MGLPIDRLVIATNQNDILHRTLETGDAPARRASRRRSARRWTSRSARTSSGCSSSSTTARARRWRALMGELGARRLRAVAGRARSAARRVRQRPRLRGGDARRPSPRPTPRPARWSARIPRSACTRRGSGAAIRRCRWWCSRRPTRRSSPMRSRPPAGCGRRCRHWMADLMTRPERVTRVPNDAGGDRGRDRTGRRCDEQSRSTSCRTACGSPSSRCRACTRPTIGIFVTAGGRHERVEQNGIAHFLEHMAFKGTPTRTALRDRRGDRGRRRLHQRLHRQGDDRLLRPRAGGGRASARSTSSPTSC